MTVSLLGAIGILASGCATSRNFATLSSGACSAFPAPQYQVKGQTSYDQKWADKTTEAGVAGCDWKRPAKRPASLNPKPTLVKDDPAPTTFKKRWYDRFLRHKPTK